MNLVQFLHGGLEELFVDSIEPQFLSSFVLQYPLAVQLPPQPVSDETSGGEIKIEVQELRKYLEVQLKTNEFSVYRSDAGETQPEAGYYFVVRLAKTVFVRRGGMFKYSGVFPRVYEIKTDGDFYRTNLQLEKTLAVIESTELKKKKVPFGKIDETSFDFVEGEDEEEFAQRAEIIRKFIMNYDDEKSPTFPDFNLKHQPLKKLVPTKKITVK